MKTANNLLVYIIVLNYNNYHDTIECLNTLFQLYYKKYRILLIDNASTDNSDEILREFIDSENNYNIEYIQSKKNGGYAAGNNIGIKYALQQDDLGYVWILNNDTLVEPNSLNRMLEIMINDKSIGICGSKLVYSWNRTRIQGYGGRYNKWLAISKHVTKIDDIDAIDYPIGASLLVSREFIEKVGLMNEEYFLFFEEMDWVLRGKKQGFKTTCASGAVVYHKEGASISGDDRKENVSKLGDFYSIRNRIVFTKKFYPYCLPTVYGGLCIAIINRIRRKQFDRIGMIFKCMLLAGNYKYIVS